MAIKNQDIKNILKIELLKLCDDLQIMDYQEAVNYDVYMMEIKNIAEIENLKEDSFRGLSANHRIDWFRRFRANKKRL